MKKILSLVLALVMVLGLSVPALAEENDKSGTTTITATKAEPFSYEIVIPTEVEGITAAGVYQVGQAKVENVVSATDNTVISYTATTGSFKLSTDENKTMAATYYTEQAATNVFPTTAVTVYENKADAASIPTMWVEIADSDWNAADPGTYTASVVFNFTAEEVVTAADALEVGARWKAKITLEEYELSFVFKKTADGFSLVEVYEDEDACNVQQHYNGLTCSVMDENTMTTILMSESEIFRWEINTANSTYSFISNGDTVANDAVQCFAVKPAGASEFTEVTLTPVEPK